VYEYLFNKEIVRLAIVLGVVVSALIYQRTGLTLGGVIVPGYLALFVPRPTHIIITLTTATLAYYIVHHLLTRRYVIYGRRLFEVEILTALLLQSVWSALMLALGQWGPELSLFIGIGFILPGVLAHDMGRQGLQSTLSSTLLGMLIVFLIILPIAAIQEHLQTINSLTPSPLLRSQPPPYGYPVGWAPLGIIASVLSGMWIFHKFSLRTGGFVTAAYLALFAYRPLDLLFVAACSAITYLLVTRVAMQVAMIFGRIKLGTMVLTGVVLAWSLEILVISQSQGRFAPWSGFTVIMPMVVALLANDSERQGLWRTWAGAGLSAGMVWLIVHGLMLTWEFLQPM